MDLTDKRVLITGSNRGIGLGLARQLAKYPTHLLLGRRAAGKPLGPEWEGTAARSVRAVRMDLSSYDTIEACCAELGADLRSIDLLINNAGYLEGGLLEEQDIHGIYTMMQANLTGWIHLTARVLPGMLARRSGKIVNNGSISCYTHLPSASTYAASKAGILGFSNALRRELAGTGVTLMVMITPGVRTDMYDKTEQVHGKYLNTSDWSVVTPEEWARRTVDAIQRDRNELWQTGQIAIAGSLARHLPRVFDLAVARLFKRPTAAG